MVAMGMIIDYCYGIIGRRDIDVTMQIILDVCIISHINDTAY